MCMYAYVCVCMCMHVHVCVCMCMHVYACVCMCMFVYVCVCTRMYAHVCACMCVFCFFVEDHTDIVVAVFLAVFDRYTFRASLTFRLFFEENARYEFPSNKMSVLFSKKKQMF